MEQIQKETNDQLDKVSLLAGEDSEMYNYLQRLKIVFTEFIENSAAGLGRIVEVEVKNSSLTNVVYSYYGDLENYDLIQQLNQFKAPSFLNGTVKLIAEQ